MASKKTPKAAKKKSKTSFVLGLPLDMSPTEVAAKAKEAGIELTPNYVSNIRSVAKRTKKAKRAGKAAAKATPTKKVAKKAAPKTPVLEAAAATSAPTPPAAPTATEFIASQPRDIPAAAVVKAAKKAGLKIEPAYVYKVRSRASAKAAKTPTPKPAAPKTEPAAMNAPKLAAKGAVSNIEGTFKRMAVELGVARATELVAEVRRTLAELFGAG